MLKSTTFSRLIRSFSLRSTMSARVRPSITVESATSTSAMVSRIPDRKVILSPTTGDVPGLGGVFGTSLFSRVRLVRLIIHLSPLAPLTSLLLVTLLFYGIYQWLRERS